MVEKKSVDVRLDDLEFRLHKYHEWLTDSIHQRDRLALDAAWGVQEGLIFLIGMAALVWFFDTKFESDNWITTTAFVIAVFVMQIAVLVWTNKRRMKEIDRLAKLPEWEWPSI